ncbi:neuromedin-U [Sorex araneus]|uniref:neuromedin-U n=1 Tax=Sorex araneus TaxID=42254 RepID=UPI00243408ED|nr:neuromedin-U [Sorex araneus]
MPRAPSRRARTPPGAGASPLPPLLLLLGCCAGACRGAPLLPQGLQPEQELQLWNELDEVCSSFLSLNSQLQTSKALEEFCFTILGTPPRPQQETDEKDNTKRFLFHYSKTQKLGNSNVVSSVLHPLLQLIPQLHERRMKRVKMSGKFQIPFGKPIPSFFRFKPRNGRRSEAYI